MKIGVATVTQLADFDQIVDVRSPAEFAEDHIPGAINCPVLDDVQRAEIGTLYTQVSPFAARRVGAAYVAAAIGRHLQEHFIEKPKHWRPLVMCWRGGQRSGAMVQVLRAIGWDARQLEGGYKAYRRQVMAELEELPQQLGWRVITGPTGSGKTRLLAALARRGGQVLDLEALAGHRGSVLGALPALAQPGQKRFETLLGQALRGFSGSAPVWVEAESRRIGRLYLPSALLAAIRAAEPFVIEAPLAARTRFLLDEYACWLTAPEKLKACLDVLRPLRGNETIARWQQMIDAGRFADLVAELLEAHYDPAYRSSQARHFAVRDDSHRLVADALDETNLDLLAERLME
ncbi:MAG: tRNA 2-selenouridine(34) synthase MnmH [Betaproteobacteria bacterium HGW-Betaproteobacteria-11]|nr:MAG: tRNA 2-selenouridine(34) synthase MnmH [Betaproteobacteria bacterium HGW-Betaproteobacteria-11]